MIFASDLDRTLMYSLRAIEELGRPENTVLRPVEKKESNWAAYMTETAFFSLKELCRNHLFIPVTTRTTEQFNRFFIFKEEIPLSYAVTANGAEILHDGKPLEEWSNFLSQALAVEAVSQQELLSLLQKESFRFTGQLKEVGKLFFYWILAETPPASEINMLNHFVCSYGWRISLQGRKLYFIPRAISKGKALEFICGREGQKAFAGAGDSLLDLDFLKLCQYRFVPLHGELKGVSENWGLMVTRNSGVAAGEEILQQFLHLMPLVI
jgi:hydroxymethylpyrimidine pyrophosphatase-like HAD family hydrolase